MSSRMRYGHCKKCGKKLAYVNWLPDRCPSCNGEVEEEG